MTYIWKRSSKDFLLVLGLIQDSFHLHSIYFFLTVDYYSNVYIFTFHCPFISWWEFRLFLLWLEKQWTRLSMHLYFKSFEHLPRSIAESYGRYNFSLLRILNTDFRNGCMILQFHWHWASICVHVSLYRVI